MLHLETDFGGENTVYWFQIKLTAWSRCREGKKKSHDLLQNSLSGLPLNAVGTAGLRSTPDGPGEPVHAIESDQ